MEHVADGVERIALPPGGAINAYLVGDVLVDSGYGPLSGRLFSALEGRTVAAHAITHAHADHAGASRKVCERLEVPLWCPEGDAQLMRDGRPAVALGPISPVAARANGWPGREPDRLLAAGDDVAGFTVLDAPGHTPGHIALWREADRVLIAGDVWFNLSLLTLRPGLRQPPAAFTPDSERNRRSIRELTALEPDVVCFGHGPVLRDAAPKLRAFAAAL